MRWLPLIPMIFLLAACQPEARPPAGVPFAPPSEENIPQDTRGNEIRYGLQLIAAPFVGVYAAFPQYRARSARVDTLEDRINDCLQRSLDGKPLSKDSREMRAMVTYMA